MLVEVDPVHVVEIADAVRHSVLRDDDGHSVPVLSTQPVDHLAHGERGNVQPAGARLVPSWVVPPRDTLVAAHR